MRYGLTGLLLFALVLSFAACSDNQETVISPERGAVTTAPLSSPVLLLSCSAMDHNGDHIDRGFYIPSYPGNSLSRVDLYMSSRTEGTFTFSLTARLDTYDGALVGTASATVDLSATDTDYRQVSFMFAGDPAVTMGSLVTFEITRTAGPDAENFYHVGDCLFDPSCVTSCQVIETNGTTPPLSTFRRNGVVLDVYGSGTMLVNVDIKPGSCRNPINLKSQGLTPVAVLGTEMFDVTQIDETTLAFGPSGATIAHKHVHYGDVNDDGYMDLMAHFATQETGIMEGATEACLTGELMDGTPVEGCDNIKTVPMDAPPMMENID